MGQKDRLLKKLKPQDYPSQQKKLGTEAVTFCKAQGLLM